MKDLETYFIRHTRDISVDERPRGKMWKQNRIYIHYPWDKSRNWRKDSRSKKPDDYTGSAKKALSKLKQLASEGGYVCAHFTEQKQWLVGIVPPKSQIQLCRGKWKPEEFKRHRLKGHDGIVILKTLLLHKPRRILPDDCVVLQPAQPRQGTITRWPSIGNAVSAIVKNQKLSASLDTLSPNHQEIMCAEFLRLNESVKIGLPRLICTLRDVGRTMKDLDIVGVAQDGKQIFAQVTYSSFGSNNVQEKHKLLQKFAEHRAYLILFCKCQKIIFEKNIIIFPIEEVYARFRKTKVGKNWFKHIFRKI
jgi:hypothetical protein